MKEKNFYTVAHLIVSAIRVLDHQKPVPPSADDVCEALSFSLEQGNLICKRLDEAGIIEIVKGAYGTRLFVRDHLKIEDIPGDENVKTMQEEIEKFQSTKKDFKEKIESYQTQKAERQKNLFAELEEKLKQGLDKK
ncbi:MAG: hypothetical protein GY795_39050 [Desulfobacterales bacterium]|nr:hypothetical protein [Desulfobacterales bacterium]